VDRIARGLLVRFVRASHGGPQIELARPSLALWTTVCAVAWNPVREGSIHAVVTTSFDPVAGKARLLELVRERAYKDGLDITLVSGKKSDFYINGKKVSLHPEGLYLIARLMLEELRSLPDVTAIGGLTMGADPIASAIAALSYETGQNLSAFLVRKEPKGHGLGSRIEGDLEKGQKVVVIEDTITTGGSALKAVDAAREVGAEVVAVMAIADREDPDAAGFRSEFDVRCLVTLSEIRQR
jgi:orotate phosphoribosyltransferase